MALKTYKKYKTWLQFEFWMEIKSRNLLVSALIQALTFVLIMFQGIINPGQEEWATFFWIIALFAALSGLSRTFIQQNNGLNLYLFQLVKATDYFIVRSFSNFLYITTLSLLTLGFLWLFYGYLPVHFAYFTLLILLSAVGFSAIFTFTGVIASNSKNAGVMLPLLAIPLLMPLLLLLFKTTEILTQQTVGFADIFQELTIILILDLFYFLPGLFLFPLLWGDNG